MLPLGCCTLKRPKIEATLTTVTGYCSGDFRDITSMPLSTPMRLMSKHNRQPSFSPKDGQIEKSRYLLVTYNTYRDQSERRV